MGDVINILVETDFVLEVLHIESARTYDFVLLQLLNLFNQSLLEGIVSSEDLTVEQIDQLATVLGLLNDFLCSLSGLVQLYFHLLVCERFRLVGSLHPTHLVLDALDFLPVFLFFLLVELLDPLHLLFMPLLLRLHFLPVFTHNCINLPFTLILDLVDLSSMQPFHPINLSPMSILNFFLLVHDPSDIMIGFLLHLLHLFPMLPLNLLLLFSMSLFDSRKFPLLFPFDFPYLLSMFVLNLCNLLYTFLFHVLELLLVFGSELSHLLFVGFSIPFILFSFHL